MCWPFNICMLHSFSLRTRLCLCYSLDSSSSSPTRDLQDKVEVRCQSLERNCLVLVGLHHTPLVIWTHLPLLLHLQRLLLLSLHPKNCESSMTQGFSTPENHLNIFCIIIFRQQRAHESGCCTQELLDLGSLMNFSVLCSKSCYLNHTLAAVPILQILFHNYENIAHQLDIGVIKVQAQEKVYFIYMPLAETFIRNSTTNISLILNNKKIILGNLHITFHIPFFFYLWICWVCYLFTFLTDGVILWKKNFNEHKLASVQDCICFFKLLKLSLQVHPNINHWGHIAVLSTWASLQNLPLLP